MNPLPQRRKSPEEIAKLRESLGVPPPTTDARVEADSPDAPPPALTSNESAAPPLAADDTPPQVDARPQLRSFKLSEHSSQPQAAASAEPDGTAQVPGLPAGAARRPEKPIRPLQRSGLAPAPAPEVGATPATAGKLPAQRHSPRELAEARRRDALAVISHGAYQTPRAAHPLLLALGYVLAIAGAAAPALLDGLSQLTGSYTLGLACGGGYHLLSGGALLALLIAGFIGLRKSLSRHHAAFIACIGFFALVFAAIHYLPQFRHAS